MLLTTKYQQPKDKECQRNAALLLGENELPHPEKEARSQ